MVHGIIYAIIDDGYFYIGSTTQSILERIGLHISASKSHSKKYKKFYKYINEVRKGWENIIYIILEEVECINNKELRNKEYEYIKLLMKDPYCLNKISDINTENIIKYERFKRKYNIV